MAAWVLAVAVPDDAPKRLRATARGLRTAVGADNAGRSRTSRLIRAAGRKLAGTTVKFTVGPMNLEMKAPDGSAPSGGTALDVEAFLQQFDEVSKYEREMQEWLVQGLLQAESVVSQLRRIRLVVFLRTDLLELYDIQEKNKLVSRTLDLTWSEEDLLQLLVNRVFANPQLEGLARRLGGDDDDGHLIDVSAALRALFPEEVEGQPIRRWLIESHAEWQRRDIPAIGCPVPASCTGPLGRPDGDGIGAAALLRPSSPRRDEVSRGSHTRSWSTTSRSRERSC